jgi:hypothetical protein
MPIQPIDLQNMFLRLNQIGKEQAEQRENIIHQQSAQNSEFVRETEHKDHSVNEPTDLPEGPKKTDDESSGQQRQSKEETPKQERDDSVSEEEVFFTDPDLGQNLDITG